MARRNQELREQIRRGYAEGRTPGEIAAVAGTTPGSVKVIAHRLGVNDNPYDAAHKRKRRTVEAAEEAAAKRPAGGPARLPGDEPGAGGAAREADR